MSFMVNSMILEFLNEIMNESSFLECLGKVRPKMNTF
jgi:hypothetical protein